jgi:hypothetical protein
LRKQSTQIFHSIHFLAFLRPQLNTVLIHTLHALQFGRKLLRFVIDELKDNFGFYFANDEISRLGDISALVLGVVCFEVQTANDYWQLAKVYMETIAVLNING